MLDTLSRLIIVTGHFGSGKTNLSVNLALDLKKNGKKVALVDLDIVNPFFRSADFSCLMKERDIELISPVFANTNVDIPSLPRDVMRVILQDDRHVVLDVGGDEVGAAALGRFSAKIQELEAYTMLYVVNRYRLLTRRPDHAVEMLREIECMSRLKATHIANNSNLARETTIGDITSSIHYANSVSECSGLPLLCNAVPVTLLQELSGVPNAYPVGIYVAALSDIITK